MCIYVCTNIYIYMGASMCNIYSNDQTIHIYFLISKYIYANLKKQKNNTHTFINGDIT